MFLSVIGKFGAVLSTLPYPVVGGGAFVGFGLLTAIGIFMLRSVNMSSFRNLAIFGLSLYIGMVIPEWIKKYPAAIDTGNELKPILLTDAKIFSDSQYFSIICSLECYRIQPCT